MPQVDLIGSLLVAFLTTISGAGFSPRMMAATLMSSGIYFLTSSGTSGSFSQTFAQATDWMLHGFPRIIASEKIPAGQSVLPMGLFPATFFSLRN